MVDSQPIGRGTVQLLKGEKGKGHSSLLGAYCMASPLIKSCYSMIFQKPTQAKCTQALGLVMKPKLIICKTGYRSFMISVLFALASVFSIGDAENGCLESRARHTPGAEKWRWEVEITTSELTLNNLRIYPIWVMSSLFLHAMCSPSSDLGFLAPYISDLSHPLYRFTAKIAGGCTRALSRQ